MHASKDSMWRGIYCSFAKFLASKLGLGHGGGYQIVNRLAALKKILLVLWSRTQWFLDRPAKAWFTFHPNPKYFLFHLSHQIFRRMNGALNVGKKDN
jgi:hypothetical protein